MDGRPLFLQAIRHHLFAEIASECGYDVCSQSWQKIAEVAILLLFLMPIMPWARAWLRSPGAVRSQDKAKQAQLSMTKVGTTETTQ